MNNLPGPERRAQNLQDHDTLIEMVQTVKAHVSNFNTHLKHYDAHIIEENKRYKEIGDKIWEHAKFIYIGIGILIALNAAPALSQVLKTLTH